MQILDALSPYMGYILSFLFPALGTYLGFKKFSYDKNKDFEDKLKGKAETLEVDELKRDIKTKADIEYVNQQNKATNRRMDELKSDQKRLETKLDNKASKEDIKLVREDIRELRELLINRLKS